MKEDHCDNCLVKADTA